MLDRGTLARHLQTLGWKAESQGDSTFRTVHATSEGDLVVYVRLTSNWLIATVIPFLSTQGDNSFELSRWLLRMNRDMYQCKFAFDEEGDVVLTVEVPTESLDYSEIKAALTSLVSAAVTYRGMLRSAAEAGE